MRWAALSSPITTNSLLLIIVLILMSISSKLNRTLDVSGSSVEVYGDQKGIISPVHVTGDVDVTGDVSVNDLPEPVAVTVQ